MATSQEIEAGIARAESAGDITSANILRSRLADAQSETLSAADQEGANLVDTYEGFGTELYEGIASGLINASEGAYSTIVSTLTPETGGQKIKNYSEGADKVREFLSIDPEGVAGTIGEVGGQYVVPSIAAMIATGGSSLPVQLAALGLTDFIVANDDYTGISNFFDNAPEVMKTENLDGYRCSHSNQRRGESSRGGSNRRGWYSCTSSRCQNDRGRRCKSG